MDDFESKLRDVIANPKNQGEMPDADAVGTVGAPDCGDMLRMWIKFKEKDGRKIIDRATFQSFGCQTAIAVASMATELLKGKTPEDALRLSTNELTGNIGPLPPMKIHCGQLVEGALRNALAPSHPGGKPANPALASTLSDSFAKPGAGKVRVIPIDPLQSSES